MILLRLHPDSPNPSLLEDGDPYDPATIAGARWLVAFQGAASGLASSGVVRVDDPAKPPQDIVAVDDELERAVRPYVERSDFTTRLGLLALGARNSGDSTLKHACSMAAVGDVVAQAGVLHQLGRQVG